MSGDHRTNQYQRLVADALRHPTDCDIYDTGYCDCDRFARVTALAREMARKLDEMPTQTEALKT